MIRHCMSSLSKSFITKIMVLQLYIAVLLIVRRILPRHTFFPSSNDAQTDVTDKATQPSSSSRQDRDRPLSISQWILDLYCRSGTRKGRRLGNYPRRSARKEDSSTSSNSLRRPPPEDLRPIISWGLLRRFQDGSLEVRRSCFCLKRHRSVTQIQLPSSLFNVRRR